ncbi:DUF7122 family protein [Haloferax profundi]|uniref:DUF7122 domain-containing protein n=1 Tax=Haloferax profundi TaxID=1544718 RepID=A0A0W1SWJ2_9EURY|nr:hypothetical protein [Haloferax profundi]KTG30842.1 hypothetical protein AUR66_05965 [Haloferax profundi]
MRDETADDENWGQQFDRLPETSEDRVVEGRPSRQEVVEWWEERFGLDPETFEHYTFWEKGAGKIWAFPAEMVDPIQVEGLGMRILRTRQRHWKPSTNAVQRFCRDATKNIIELGPGEAKAFVAGHDQQLDWWEGDWGYLVAAHELAGEREPLGVGLYLHGELRSTVPKGRQEDLKKLD